MIEQHWQSAFELFAAAAPLDAGGRRALLESSGVSPTILAEVRVLLGQLDSGESVTAPIVETLPLPVGSRIGRNEITGEIGRGGMSRVYSAYDPELDRTVAIKIVNPSVRGAGDTTGKPVHEARTASALNHPNIVTVHEVIPHEPGLAIVMELIEGQTLRSFTHEPMPLDRFLAVASQLAQALAVAHSQSIVHRDIKPENVMVRRDGYVKVLDFGLARREWVIPKGGRLSGTPRYMSPEQALDGELTAATDIFSLGLVLYELATGVYPFAGKTPIEMMHAIVSDKPRPPAALRPQLPAGLNALLLEMLRKEPERRPSAPQVAGRLEALKQGGRKRRWLMAVPAVLASAALAAAGARFYFLEPPEPALRQTTNHVAENRITASAVSPDGSRLAYATADAIFVRSVAGGETITHNGPVDFLVDRISWFPGAAALLLSGSSANTQKTALWRLSLQPPGLRLIREDADNGAVSADGSRLAFCSAMRSEIWVSGADGENPLRVLTHESDDFPFLLWTPGGKLAYSRRYWDTSRRVLDSSFETMDADSRRVLSRWDHVPMQSAVYVAGSRLLFLGLKIGDGAAIADLWETEADRDTGAIRRSPRQRTRFIARLASLSASTSGDAVSVINTSGNQAVFVGDFDARSRRITSRRRLVLDDHSNYPHAWSPDSQYLVFEAYQKRTLDLFRQRLDRAFPEPLVVAPEEDYMARLSPDGRWYLFSRALEDPNSSKKKPAWVMRVAVEGGTPVAIHKGVPSDEFRCAGFGRRAPGAPPCVLLLKEGRESVFYALDPERGKGPELRRITREEGESIYGDWDLSPDGSTAAIPCHQRRHAHVQLLPLKAASPPKDVVLAGLANLNGVTWSADGSGWFVTLIGSLGSRMVYSDLEGRATSLGVRGWAVPSPDGRRIAYLDNALPSNVFFIDRM